MKIMFICTGNICRSAMAEAMLKKLAEENNKEVEVYSCGIYAETGACASYTAIEVMKEYDIDLRSHKATNIVDSKIQTMDVLLCATQSHKRAVLKMYPEMKEKVYTMKEYVGLDINGQNEDIADPWGYDINIYRKCTQDIEEVLKKMITILPDKKVDNK